MRAVLVNPELDTKLEFCDVDPPVAERSQAIVRVTALSLNRGELTMAQNATAPCRIGWDIAGVVETSAANGQGPAEGTRVVAFLPSADGWAERNAVDVELLAPIPDGMSDTVAAALPVAGLTALRGLDKGVRVAGRKVAISGATGGVGTFAVQIARAMGATVVAQVRREAQVDAIQALGAHQVVVSEDGAAFKAHGPYAIAFDGLGGSTLEHLVTCLDRDGVAVTYGGTAAYTIAMPIFGLARTASIYGFSLYNEITAEPGGLSLTRLMTLVQQGAVNVQIGHEDRWENIADTAQALIARAFSGKAVLSVGSLEG